MIVGMGVDVCEISRIERALADRAGARFRARVFTDAEVAYCGARGRTAPQSYAVTFAAKEAALKAFGTGWGKGLNWQSIEVARDASGKPALVLHGAARALARRRGVGRAHVTLSHAGGLAMAVVVLERGAAARARARRPTGRRRSR
jgi:holo-[acyl-carrier protein] synthase